MNPTTAIQPLTAGERRALLRRMRSVAAISTGPDVPIAFTQREFAAVLAAFAADATLVDRLRVAESHVRAARQSLELGFEVAP